MRLAYGSYSLKMETTPYHAKFFTHDLTRRFASDCMEKLATVLADAQLDLNPELLGPSVFRGSRSSVTNAIQDTFFGY